MIIDLSPVHFLGFSGDPPDWDQSVAGVPGHLDHRPAGNRDQSGLVRGGDRNRTCGGGLPRHGVAAPASRSFAADPTTDLAANSAHHLVADVERCRQHLGVTRWLRLVA